MAVKIIHREEIKEENKTPPLFSRNAKGKYKHK